MSATPDPRDLTAQVRHALAEDLGSGDLTAGLMTAASKAHAEVVARESAILCGRAWFDEVFRQLDPAIVIDWLADDGDSLQSGQRVCGLSGGARPLLSGERTALNFLQTLSGTATLTADYVAAVAGTGAIILDTRKTIPGLRMAQKYAVRCGGATNHRMGLYDAVLIKENHIRAAGSIAAAVQSASSLADHGVLVEIEVESLAQLDQALAAGATRMLLDNFGNEALREAVQRTAGRAKLEASGGVNLATVREIALTGVDFISVGQLTKDVVATDYSMLFL
ncbi:MAG: carboxylating nicotinate-nucleotide diphosphorylase [Sedimenticolaceae bacterium]